MSGGKYEQKNPKYNYMHATDNNSDVNYWSCRQRK